MEEMEIVSLRSFVEDGGACLTKLLSQVLARGMRTFRFPKVHTAEISEEFLKTLAYRFGARHRLYAARAQSALSDAVKAFRQTQAVRPQGAR